MKTYIVHVEFSTHDGLKAGSATLGTNTVRVWASDRWEASLVAAQMTACHNVIPTSTEVHFHA